MEYNQPSEIVKDVNFGENANKKSGNRFRDIREAFAKQNIGKDPRPSQY